MVYNGGPYISLGTIADYGDSIGPLNLPYARVSDNIQTIIEKTITDTFVPWEWWLDYTGAFQVAEERGSDKSTLINLEAAIHIGESTNERSSKQTKQRVRVVGRGESADQDENTSDWHEDTTEMATINSFYEYIQGEKTISSKSEADIWSQVLLTLEASINQEITIRLENNPYTTNDFDVGDYITATDPATLISGKMRVKTIETNVDGDGGEVTIVTCTKRRTDISDRLADMYKTLEKLMLSSTYIDAMYAEGGSQTKLSADAVEDVWEQTASNKWDAQLPEESPATEITLCDYTTDVTYWCDKDLFEITCGANSHGNVMLDQPRLKFSRDPRFTCEFEIDTDTGDVWEDDDFAYIRIQQVDDVGGLCSAPYGVAGFGFRIMKISGAYELRSYLNDVASGTTVEIKIANLTADIKYIVEARLQWKEKIVMFYFGKADVEKDDLDYGFRLRGIAPISLESADEDNLVPFYVVIDSRHAPQTQKLVIPIYRWKTQAVRAVEG